MPHNDSTEEFQRLEYDLTDLPRIAYKQIKGVCIARFIMPISYDSEVFFNKELLRIGFEPNEKVENPKCAFCYVLKRDNKRVVTAKYRKLDLDQYYLDIAGLAKEVEKIYDEFKNNGVFYFNIANINLTSKCLEFLIKNWKKLKK